MTTPVLILLMLVLPRLMAEAFSKLGIAEHPDREFWNRFGLAVCFIFFGVGHFVQTEAMVEMLPAWLPFRSTIVVITGVMEFAVGIALLIPALKTVALYLAAAMFVAFFPANIYAAINEVGLGGHQWGLVYLLIRTPLQAALIFWTWSLIKMNKETKHA